MNPRVFALLIIFSLLGGLLSIWRMKEIRQAFNSGEQRINQHIR